MSDKGLINVDQVKRLIQYLDDKSKEETIRATSAEEELKRMLGGKSIVYLSQAEYDDLSEEEKEDITKIYFITDAENMEHEHPNKEFLDSLSQELLDTKANQSELLSKQDKEDENLNTEDKTIVGAINELNELIPCRDTRKTTTVEFTFNGTIGNKEVNYEINDGTTTKGHVKVSDINFEQMISGNAMFRIGIFMSGMNIGGGDGVYNFEKLQDNLYVTDTTYAYIIIALDNVTTTINSVSRTFTKGIWVYYNLKSGMTTTITSAKLNIVVSGEIQGIDEKYLTKKPGLNVKGKEFNADYQGYFGDEIFNDLDENIASGGYAHAEGWKTQAINQASHAEGKSTIASGPWSHAEGWETQATKQASHAEGEGTIASGPWSHAEGRATIASGENQHVQGKYNIEDTENKYAHIVGNGENPLAEYRSNAHTLDWDGNAWFAGNVSIGVDNKQLATEEFVNDAIDNIPEGFSGDYNDLTNKPVIPSIEGLASETYVQQQVAGIIDAAPETLNTLNELAQALGDDPNFATTIATEIGKKADKSELFSGSYDDLTNKPEIPSIEGLATEELVNNLNNDAVESINEINTELETKASKEFVNSMLNGLKLVQITQSEYDALEEKDPSTLYIVI